MKRLAIPVYLAVLSVLLPPGYVVAEIYKCKDETGQIIFSDKKCGDKPEKITIKKDPKSKRPVSKAFFCPSGVTAVVNNLHYPTLNDTNEAIRLAESDFANLRYRKLIKRVDPEDKLPDRVSLISAEAFLASEVPGFSNGVVVNMQIGFIKKYGVTTAWRR